MFNLILYRLRTVRRLVAVGLLVLTGTVLAAEAGTNAARHNFSNDFVLKLQLEESNTNGFPGRKIIPGFGSREPNDPALLGYAAPSAAGIGNARILYRLFTTVRFNNSPVQNSIYTADVDELRQLLGQGWRFGGVFGNIIAEDDRREFTDLLFRLRSRETFRRANGTFVPAYTYISGASVSVRDNFLSANPEWEADATVGRVSPLNFQEELRTRGVGREVINLAAQGFQVYDCRQPNAPFIGPLADLQNQSGGLFGSHFNRPALDFRGSVSGQVNIDLGGLEPDAFPGGPWWLLLDADRSAVRGQVAVRAPSLAADSIGRLLLDIVETRGNGFQGARFIVRDNLNGGLRPIVCPAQDIFYSAYAAVYRFRVAQ
jgi:hypothetical protein